jgi:hypothetical protein
LLEIKIVLKTNLKTNKMKNKIAIVLCCILSIGFSLPVISGNLYLIANNGTTWSGQTPANTGFTNVYKVDLSQSGADGATAVSLAQWLTDRGATPTYKINGSVGVIFASTDQVWIAGGIYPITTAWSIGETASTYGGFQGKETTLSARAKGANVWEYSNETILSGTGSITSAITAGGNRSITIDGLSLTNFTSNAIVAKPQMTLQNCRFYSNSVAPVYAYCNADSKYSITIQGCQFKNNIGSGTTACGIVTQTGSNAAYLGANILTIDIKGCVFDGNINTNAAATGYAGALYFFTNGGFGLNHKVTNCSFINNECVNSKDGASAISSTTNSSSTPGSISIANCLFYSNGSVTTNSKPALYISNSSTLGTFNCNVWNSTLVNNVSGGAKITNSSGVNFYNTVFWGADGNASSGSGYVNCLGTNPVFTNCAYNSMTSGSTVSCLTLPRDNSTGLNAPQFVDPINNNWHLTAASPLLDASISTASPSTTLSDLEGVVRPSGAKYDLGVYEFPSTLSISTASLIGLNYDKAFGPSLEQVFTLSGVALNGNVTLTPSSNIQLSTSAGTGFVSTPLIITPSQGALAVTSIYVRLKASLNVANYADSILISSPNAATKKVNCSGSVKAAALTVSSSALSGLDYDKGSGPSPEQMISVSGSGIGSTLTLTPSKNIQISTTSGSGFISTPLELTPTMGAISSTNIYVRLKAGLTFANYADSIVVSGTNVLSKKVYCSGTVKGPTISNSVSSLSGLNFLLGKGPSDSLSFTVTAALLEADLLVNPSTSFEISTDGISYHATPIVLSPRDGLVDSTKIYVRLKAGVLTGSYNESISLSSLGATHKTIAIDGTVDGPIIFSSASTISALDYVLLNGPSSPQSLVVSGTRLATNLLLTPTSNIELSKDGTIFHASPIEITPLNGTLVPTTVYVRLKAGLIIGEYKDSIRLTSTDAISKTIACSGTIIGPVLIVSTSALNGFNYVAGNGPSDQQSFTVSGANLTSNVVLSPSSNFQLSKVSGGVFSSSPLILSHSNGVLNTTTVYVRLKAGVQSGNYSANITLTATNADTKSVECTGFVNAAPTLTSNPNTTDEIKVYAVSSIIVIAGATTNEIIKVYTLYGVLLRELKATSDLIEVPMNKDAVYLVRVGNKTFKLVI